MVVFGLSFNNLDMLKKGHPIRIGMSELGFEGEIFIFAAADERTMEEMFENNEFTIGTKIGSTCPGCRTGFREDGSCDCEESTQ